MEDKTYGDLGTKKRDIIHLDTRNKKSFVNNKNFKMEDGYTAYTSPQSDREVYYNEDYLIEKIPNFLEILENGGVQ